MQRASNMELLRIVSMLMVLCVHIDGASLGLPANTDINDLSARDIWRYGVESLAIIGVNCFTLISGYFKINLRLKSIGIYLFQCVFYSVLIYTVLTPVLGHEWSWLEWGESWMVLTHTDLWYVPAYFALMLLAPFINAAFDTLPRRKVIIFTGAFVIFNLWAGWYFDGSFNPTGYTVIQLVMMYMIGRCISLCKDIIGKFKKPQFIISCFSIYVLFSVITTYYALSDWLKAYAYNAPAVMIASVAFMMAFSAMDFRSKSVNYVAKSAFAVYLIHKSPLIWGNYLKPYVWEFWQSLSLFHFTLAAICLMLAIYAISMLIDAVRRTLSSIIFH